MELIINGFISCLQPINILIMVVGLVAGIFFGSLPGLTATMGVAVFVPFTFWLDPSAGLLLLSGVFCGAIYGGSVSAVLLGIPGTPASLPTVWDGQQMARRGQAGRALHLATIGSTFGGLMSSLSLMIGAPVLALFALKVGPPEAMMLAIFGMSVVGALSAGNIVKGLIMGFFSMLLATFGQDPVNGFPRFTYGMTDMLNGFSLVPVLIGVFSLPEVFNLLEEIARGGVQSKAASVGSMRIPIKDLLKQWAVFIKCSIIGIVIGIIPAAGADIAAFLGYNETKRSSKHPERMGTGVDEGVLAPEVANNAVTGASLIPLLTLSIPGSAPAALYLGALYVHGLRPGPTLFEKNAPVVWALISGFFVINILMYFIGIAYCKMAGNIVLVSKAILVPSILTLTVIGTYACNNSWFDVLIMFIFGVLGYILQKNGFPLSPIALGLILGPIFELAMYQSLVMFDGNILKVFTRPIAVLFLFFAVISVGWPYFMSGFKKLSRKNRT